MMRLQGPAWWCEVPQSWIFASHVEIEAETGQLEAYAAFLSAEAPEADAYFRAGPSAYGGTNGRGSWRVAWSSERNY